jgi:hypothetical protein
VDSGGFGWIENGRLWPIVAGEEGMFYVRFGPIMSDWRGAILCEFLWFLVDQREHFSGGLWLFLASDGRRPCSCE